MDLIGAGGKAASRQSSVFSPAIAYSRWGRLLVLPLLTHTRAHAHACTHAHYTHALTTHAPHTHATTTTRARMHYAYHTHTRARAATQKLTYPTRANHCDAHTNITRTHSVPRPTCIFGFRPGVYDKESAVQSPVHLLPLAPRTLPQPPPHLLSNT